MLVSGKLDFYAPGLPFSSGHVTRLSFGQHKRHSILMSRGCGSLCPHSLFCSDPQLGATKKRSTCVSTARFTPHRATVIPSWWAPYLQGLEPAEPRVANGVRQGEDLLVPSSSCSHKTNFGAARNWQQPGAPSTPHDWPHAGLASYHNTRYSRTLRSGEGEATTPRSSSSLHTHFLWVLNQD
jgi:hypothetical protein